MRSVAILFLAVVPMTTFAESNIRFQWRSGEKLQYRVAQDTTVQDTADGQTLATQTKLNLTKQWTVANVDSAGVATLQMSLLHLRMETKKGNGDPIIFDSSKTDSQQAELNKEMLQYIGQPIATLRIDSQGRVIEVKESKFGPASRFTSELPFRLTLPDVGPIAGQSWERTYSVKLEPPQGAGETYDAVQKYTATAINDGIATITLTTQIKNLPEAAVDRISLIPMSPTGVLTFNLKSGRLQKAELKMAAQLAEHRGAGSSFTFSSTYTEEQVER
jgi:hypothetical protein